MGSATDWTASEADQKNQHHIVAWSLAWIVPFLAADLAIENEWINNNALAVIATIAVTLLGLGVLFAFRRFLRDADELVRKIHTDALVLTSGIGFVSAFSYTLLEGAGVVSSTKATNVVVVMAVTYMVSVFVGLRRYS